MELRLLKRVENLSLGLQRACLLAPTTRFAVPFTLSKQRKVVFEVADGVTTPEEGRELVSRAAESMSLSPDYSIRHAFDF
jgi:hypothetical protein